MPSTYTSVQVLLTFYPFFRHEDLLQAIFLHYIGVQWSVFFKSAFQNFRGSAWKSNSADIPKQDRMRREYYLGPTHAVSYYNIEDIRATKHKKQYFAHQLLDYREQKVEVEEGEEEAEYDGTGDEPRKRGRTQQTARVNMMMQVWSPCTGRNGRID
jgi:hypothetical protein